MKCITIIFCLFMSSCVDEEIPPSTFTKDLKTVEHDNHKFIIYETERKGNVIHHPGCLCLNKNTNEK